VCGCVYKIEKFRTLSARNILVICDHMSGSLELRRSLQVRKALVGLTSIWANGPHGVFPVRKLLLYCGEENFRQFFEASHKHLALFL
jgi:hypothetical protein